MRNSNIWYNLDNQANIYPSINDSQNTNVYRISCTLKENINPDTLQIALDKSMISFSYYQMIIRRGLFWYYLEPSDLPPEVILENQRPCKQIFFKGERNLLFQVSYYKKRINIEVFHALADGGGAMEFFKDIVYNYILLEYKDKLPENPPILIRSAPPASKAEDGFRKHYTGKSTKSTPFSKKSFTIGGSTIPFNNISVISAKMNVKDVLALAKENGVTMTAYFTALMICAIEHELMPKRYADRDISILVPVDLRGFFPSQTFRNFFSVVSVRYNFAVSPKDFDSVLVAVSEQLKEKINPDSLLESLNYNIDMQQNILTRWVPLFIKNRVIKLAYKKGEAANTTTISNLGRIDMPSFTSDYIEYFTCLLNPTPIQKVKLCVNSYNNTLSLDFTSVIEETDIQRYFIRHLSEKGIDITVSSNRSEII